VAADLSRRAAISFMLQAAVQHYRDRLAERAIIFNREVDMSVITAAEELALGLSVADRAKLATTLLRSLPAVNADDDGGLSLAIERDRALDAHPTRGITLEELDRRLTQRFPYIKK